MRYRAHATVLLGFAVLLAGCEAKVRTEVSTQPIIPLSEAENGNDTPGLEEMPDDGQGTIYF